MIQTFVKVTQNWPAQCSFEQVFTQMQNISFKNNVERKHPTPGVSWTCSPRPGARSWAHGGGVFLHGTCSFVPLWRAGPASLETSGAWRWCVDSIILPSRHFGLYLMRWCFPSQGSGSSAGGFGHRETIRQWGLFFFFFKSRHSLNILIARHFPQPLELQISIHSLDSLGLCRVSSHTCPCPSIPLPLPSPTQFPSPLCFPWLFYSSSKWVQASLFGPSLLFSFLWLISTYDWVRSCMSFWV